MKFYSLKYFEDECRENPSIQDFRAGYDTDAANSATKIHHYEKIGFTPDLDFVLDKKGKATDLLVVSFVGSDHLVVSEKLYGLLDGFNLLSHQHFRAVVRKKDELMPYHFLHFYFRFDSDENGLVDFEQTRFVAQKAPFPLSIMAVPTEEEGVVGAFQVGSWSEYHELRERVENDFAHKIVLPLETLYVKRKDFLELDLFYVEFKNFGSQFVISERLAKAMIDESITGVKVDPLPFEIRSSVG